MGKLSIEKKAIAYDEAIEKLRNAFYNNNSRMCEEYRNAVLKIIEPIFPELKESYDEMIRKALIDGFTVMKESKNCGKTFSNHNIPVADIIAWLEKQGEKA